MVFKIGFIFYYCFDYYFQFIVKKRFQKIYLTVKFFFLYIKFCLKSVDEEKYDEFATNHWSNMAK